MPQLVAPEEPEHELQGTDIPLLFANQEGLVPTDRLGSLQTAHTLPAGQPRAEKLELTVYNVKSFALSPMYPISAGVNDIPSTSCHKAVTP